MIKNSLPEFKQHSVTDGSKVSKKNVAFSLGKPVKEVGKPSEDSDSDPDIVASSIISTGKSGQSLKGLEDKSLHAQSVMLTDDGDSVFPSEVITLKL